ncbi:hypothetical protein EDB89DRAFT_2080521 [Lactarius sanguifluus]|nr:hypothetical protein EDB89DRAFT_2080521 [Lactarius sanguifluus]
MQQPNKKAKDDRQKGKETSKTGTGVSGGLPQSPPSPPAFLAMARAAAPSLPHARPRANFKDIIMHPSASNLIDPDALDVDDNDSNKNWGHAQFTAGGLTIRSALVDWESDLQGGQGIVYHERVVLYDIPGQQLSRTISSSASPLAPAAAASGSSDAEPPPSKSKPAPKPKPAPSKPKATPSKPKAAPSKSQAGPFNSSGTAPTTPAEPSPTKPSGAKAGPSKTKAGPSKLAKHTKPAATNLPTKPAPKRATRSHAAKAHRSALMDQD